MIERDHPSWQCRPESCGGTAHDPCEVVPEIDKWVEMRRLQSGWRMVTSRLGYGDGITEPQIGFGEFLRECEEKFSEASDWRESQRWRDDCAAAGHPDDEDCFEHDPALRLERAERIGARVEALTNDPMWASAVPTPVLRAALNQTCHAELEADRG